MWSLVVQRNLNSTVRSTCVGMGWRFLSHWLKRPKNVPDPPYVGYCTAEFGFHCIFCFAQAASKKARVFHDFSLTASTAWQPRFPISHIWTMSSRALPWPRWACNCGQTWWMRHEICRSSNIAGWSRMAIFWHRDECIIHPPWELKTFIFRGYNPYIGGLKPLFFRFWGPRALKNI